MDRPSSHSRGKSTTAAPITDAPSSVTEQSYLAPKPSDELADSIETVIDQKERPKLNQKPSWIGRPALGREHSCAAKMKQKVVIQYQAPGLRPPVFITTSLSQPEWDVLEMTSTKQSNDELMFHIEFDAEEGEYQYKFRLGPGDWWVCDEEQPTVDDDLGNRNNILYVVRTDAAVKSAEQPSLGTNTSPVKTTVTTGPNVQEPATPAHTRSDSAIQQEHAEKHADDDWDEEPPLLKHEKTYPGQVDTIPDNTVFSSPSSSSKSDLEEDIFPEVDTRDPHLHQFPTHHSGIMEELSRAYKRDIGNSQQPATLKRHSSNGISATLPQVQGETEDIVMLVSEDEDEHPPEPAHVPSPTPYHRHAHHGHHHHHHPAIAEVDMEHERKINTTELQPRGGVAMLGDVFFGAVFAVVVAIVALVLYSTGSLRQQDTAKDGGAALGS